ncbi:MAG: hypothetical protein GVY19_06645 [Bacteroidetes bacterium]|jgi:asparagine synthase (glutamine-hydrolysing)|nr:hypothetical protein [Bacteroidota bacterium]
MNTLFALAGNDRDVIKQWTRKIVNHHPFHYKHIRLFVGEKLVLGEVFTDNQFKKGTVTEQPLADEVLCIDGQPYNIDQAQSFTDYLQLVKGFYALWSVNAQKKELDVATDYLASHPIFYTHAGPVFMASNCFKLLTGFVSDKMDHDWLRDMLMRQYSGFDYTFIQDVKRVPPGSFLTFQLSGNIRIQRYKDVYPKDFTTLTWQQSTEQLDALLTKSVRQAVSNHENIGVELSAGIDSSCVLAYSHKLAGHQKTRAFSHVNKPDSPFQTDEREDIQHILAFIPDLQHHYVDAGNAGILNIISHTIDQLGFVPNQFFEVFTQNIYQTALKNNIDLLLSGFGGDQGISYKGKMFYQQLFRDQYWRRMIKEMSCDPKTTAFQSLKLIFSMTAEWLIPVMYANLKNRRYQKDFAAHHVHEYVKPEVIEKYRLKELFVENNLQRNLYQPVHQAQYQQLVHPFVTQRLQMAYAISQYMGFSYKHPLLDEELIRFFLQLPYQHKFRNGVNRFLIRELIKEKMPPSIYTKTSKQGAAVPSVFDRLLNETDRLLAFVLYCERKEIGTEWFQLNAIKDALHRIKNSDGKDLQNLPRIINYITLMVYFAKKEGFHAFFEKP